MNYKTTVAEKRAARIICDIPVPVALSIQFKLELCQQNVNGVRDARLKAVIQLTNNELNHLYCLLSDLAPDEYELAVEADDFALGK